MKIVINQRTNGDCGVCCLAMMSGETYESILKSCFENKTPYGVSFGKMIECLKHLGYRPAWIIGWNETTTGILSVPSLNHLGKLHFIYYDGNQVYDPNNGMPGKKFYDKGLLKDSSVDSSIIQVNKNDQIAEGLVYWCKQYFSNQANELEID